MSELNRLKVVDFTAGRLSSDDINTNIPFRDNLAKTRTIQQANAVIGAYVNRNYVDMQNKADKDEIPTKLSELENDTGYITEGDIPSKTSDLENDSGFITKDVDDLTNYLDKTTVEDEFDSIWRDMQDFNGELGDIRTAIDFKTPKRVGDLVVDSIRSKNMFSFNYEVTDTGVTHRVINNSIVQTNAGAYARSNWEITGLKIGTTYTLSCNYTNNNSCSIRTSICNSTNTTLIIETSATTNTSGNFSLTFTATETSIYIRFYTNTTSSGNTNTVTFSEIQLEEGLKTPYSPHQELNGLSAPIELLGDTTPTANTSYTLNDSIFNYKYILIVMTSANTFANSSREYIPISQLSNDSNYRVALSVFQSTTVYMFLDLYFDTYNSIRCNGITKGTTGWTPHIKVYGIK